MNNLKLRDYQEYFISKIDKHDLLVIDWYTGKGIDFTLGHYINNTNLKVGYCGYRIIHDQFDAKDLNYFPDFEKIIASDIDVLIFEVRSSKNHSNIIDYCLSHNIKLILKRNYKQIDLSDYKYFFSDGTASKKQDRLKKFKRILDED